jgi:hypothetical protein
MDRLSQCRDLGTVATRISAARSVAAPFTEQGLRTIRPASTAVSMIRASSR